MSIIHLQDRTTRDRGHFSANKESHASLVWTSELGNLSAFEIALTVGRSYTTHFPAREEQFLDIQQGQPILVSPGQSILVTTEEEIHLPYNLFGVIFPKGSLAIRYSVIVPTTKIDPGFSDRLYIHLTNFGKLPYRLSRGDPIATVSFFSTDSTPSDIPETLRPDYRGKIPHRWDRFRSKARGIAERGWEVFIAALGGGLLVFLLQRIFGG